MTLLRPSPPAAPPIAAIATPPGRGGIGIVRVSGPDLGALIAGIAGRQLTPRIAMRVTFRDADGSAIDAGVALHFPRPNSYTGEDVVEWHGHGGPVVMRLLLARCVELGARLAEPGEFTKRAFLNGKLDLAQAESVADVIDAATASAVRAAARSLTGDFSREVHALRDGLIDLRMYTEATLDFPEEELDLLREGDVRARLASIRARLADVLARSKRGSVLREGLVIVLVGAPNVGKSSLLNRLVREEAAIVTPIPGTTRDTIERQVEIGGIPVTIVDTAGLRETDDPIEALGIARTRAAIGSADLALVMVDARDDADDLRGASGLRNKSGNEPPRLSSVEERVLALASELPPAMPRIIVHNKCDLAGIAAHVEQRDAANGAVWLCALTGEGVDLLEAKVQHLAGIEEGIEDAFFARARHLAALHDAVQHLDIAGAHAECVAPPIELIAEELRIAQNAFSTITGEFTADDLLGEIFSRFCIGK